MFKDRSVFRLRCGFRLSVRVGYGFQICDGLIGFGPRVKTGLGCIELAG